VRKRQREKKEEDRKSESIQLQRVKELLGMEKKATRADTLEKGERSTLQPFTVHRSPSKAELADTSTTSFSGV